MNIFLAENWKLKLKLIDFETQTKIKFLLLRFLVVNYANFISAWHNFLILASQALNEKCNLVSRFLSLLFRTSIRCKILLVVVLNTIFLFVFVLSYLNTNSLSRLSDVFHGISCFQYILRVLEQQQQNNKVVFSLFWLYNLFNI